MTPFTPDQIEWLETFAVAVVNAGLEAQSGEEAKRNSSKKWPATVASYSDDPSSPVALCTVLVDADPEPRQPHEAQVLFGVTLTPGDRVLIEFDPPQGIGVVGFYGQAASVLGRLDLTAGYDLSAGGVPFDCEAFTAGIDGVNLGTNLAGLSPPASGLYSVTCELGLFGSFITPVTDPPITGSVAIVIYDNAGAYLGTVAAQRFTLASTFPQATTVHVGTLAAAVPAGGRIGVFVVRDDGSGATLYTDGVAVPSDYCTGSHLDAIRVGPYLTPAGCHSSDCDGGGGG